MNRTYKYLMKGELQEANRQAIKAGGRAIEPDYIDGLAANLRFPIFFELPWERHGFVRCQIGTGVPGEEYIPLFIDVPLAIYDHLSVIHIPVEEEVQS